MRLADLRTTRKLGYRPELDGLRAIAVGLVVVFHYGIPGGAGGFLGVDIFFVLSGFLITTLLLEEIARSSTVSLKDFYLRRMMRLMPALLAMLIAVFALVLLIGDDWQLANFDKNALATLLYANNITRAMFHSWDGPTLGHAWSLAIEEQFYLLWPGLLLLMRRWPARRVIGAVSATIVVIALWRAHLQLNGTWTERIYLGTDTRSDELLVGALAAIVRFKGYGARLDSLVRHRITPWICSSVIIAAVLARPLPNERPWWFPIGIPVFECATALLVLAIVDARPRVIVAQLTRRPLLAVGRISYELYLVHVPIAYFVLGRSRHLLPNDYAYVVVWITVSLAVAFTLNRWVARPLQRLRHRAPMASQLAVPTGAAPPVPVG